MIQMLPEKSILCSLACNIFRFRGREVVNDNCICHITYPDLNGAQIGVNLINMVAAHTRFLALSLWESRSDFADVQLNCKDGVFHLNRCCSL